MAKSNGEESNTERVLLLGDNRITASIIAALGGSSYILDQATFTGSQHDKDRHIQIHKTDFSSTSLSKLFATTQPDVVVSCISGGSFDTQKCIIDSVVAANIPSFIAAEFGHDSLNSNIQARLPPCKERARTIEYLEHLLPERRTDWLALSTGLCLDHGIHSGDLGFDIKWTSITMHGSGDERFAACSQAWYGRVVQHALQHWASIRNQYLYVPGLVTSANDVAKALEEATSKSWDVGRGDVDECLREAERRVQRGFPDAAMFLAERSVMYDESLQAVAPYVSKDARHDLGLDEERLDDVVQAALHHFKHHGDAGCGCD